MNDLDIVSSYNEIDRSGMHVQLADLPNQCQSAFESGMAFFRAQTFHPLNHIVIAAMGGSAMGATFAIAAYSENLRIPVTIWRNYGLPASADGNSLVIVLSKSGNTEESLSAMNVAVERGCRIIVLTGGGQLADRATQLAIPVFQYHYMHTPREGVGWITMPVIALLHSLGLIEHPGAAVDETIRLLGLNAQKLGILSVAIRNPAKRIAGQIVERLPVIYASGILVPVAHRWKTLLNENAKLLATVDEIPELNHNAVVGYEQAEDVWRKSIVIQLRSSYDHPRVFQRFDITRRLLLESGINQDTVHAQGTSALAQIMSLVQFGDWVSYYAAIMTGIDPTPTNAIDWIKSELSATTGG